MFKIERMPWQLKGPGLDTQRSGSVPFSTEILKKYYLL